MFRPLLSHAIHVSSYTILISTYCKIMIEMRIHSWWIALNGFRKANAANNICTIYREAILSSRMYTKWVTLTFDSRRSFQIDENGILQRLA